MAAYVKLYLAATGELVSEAGIFLHAILEACLIGEEGTPVKLYAEADAGYSIADCTWTPTGTTADMWALALDGDGGPGEWGDWGAALNIGTVVDDIATDFWIKGKATSEEVPSVDDSVSLEASGTVTLGVPLQGVVYGADETLLEGVLVAVYNGTSTLINAVETDVNGAYSTTVPADGSYFILFSTADYNLANPDAKYASQYYNGEVSYAAADGATIPNLALDVTLSDMTSTVDITGTVTDASTEDAIEGAVVFAVDASAAGMTSGSVAPVISEAITDGSGAYELDGLQADTTYVLFCMISGYYSQVFSAVNSTLSATIPWDVMSEATLQGEGSGIDFALTVTGS